MPRDSDDISNISVLFDPDYEVKDHHRRRNKMLLIVACCVRFCIFVGLAAGLGSSAANSKEQQEQSNSVSELNDSESNADVDNTGVAASTIASPTVEEEKEVPTTNGMLTEEEQAVWREKEAEGGAVQQETTDEMTTTAKSNIVPNVVNAPTDPSSSNSIETVIDNTDILSTMTDTTNNAMTATAVPAGYSSPEGTDRTTSPPPSIPRTVPSIKLWRRPIVKMGLL